MNQPAILTQPATGVIQTPVVFRVCLDIHFRKIGFRMMKKTIWILCVTVFLLTGCVALQQDVITLERRMDTLEYRTQELQKQNENLNKQVSSDLSAIGENRESSEKTLRGQYAGLSADMERMQQDLRLLSGRVEEIEYAIKRKLGDYESGSQKRQDRMDELNLSMAKMDQRIGLIEQYLNMEGNKQPGQTTAAPAAAAAPTAPAATTDQQIYTQARQAYDRGELDQARQLFQKLIKEFPKSSIVDNAQFWIGESYYREKWYEKAILEYQTVIEKYPHGNKVPAAMLKQGLALKQIGEKSSARLILQELVKKYPKASEAAVAEQKLKEF
jgi:tol-pal system protein YbgF